MTTHQRRHDPWAKDVMTNTQLRKRNLNISRRLVHNSMSAGEWELRNAVNDLGDEVTRLEGVVKKLQSQLRETKRRE